MTSISFENRSFSFRASLKEMAVVLVAVPRYGEPVLVLPHSLQMGAHQQF